MSAGTKAGGALLDLDGTLVDTAPDMVAALNHLLAEHDMSALPYEDVRPHVSHGALRLLRLGFGETLGGRDPDTMRGRYLEIYAEDVCRGSQLFPGFAVVLEELEDAAVPWGVVTNKPGWLTGPLLDGLGLAERAACIVSGDTLSRAKPHPMPLLHAAELLRIPVERCVYVGDSERDITAGRAAGMHTVIALYGYIPDNERPGEWNAHGAINHPGELLDWIAMPAGEAQGEPAGDI